MTDNPVVTFVRERNDEGELEIISKLTDAWGIVTGTLDEKMPPRVGPAGEVIGQITYHSSDNDPTLRDVMEIGGAIGAGAAAGFIVKGLATSSVVPAIPAIIATTGPAAPFIIGGAAALGAFAASPSGQRAGAATYDWITSSYIGPQNVRTRLSDDSIEVKTFSVNGQKVVGGERITIVHVDTVVDRGGQLERNVVKIDIQHDQVEETFAQWKAQDDRFVASEAQRNNPPAGQDDNSSDDDRPTIGPTTPPEGPGPTSPPRPRPENLAAIAGSGAGAQPLIIDLDGKGLSVLPGSFATFDMDGDGFRERTAWAGPEDGFLVIDLNADGSRGAGDGKITLTKELVFTDWVENDNATDLQALATIARRNGNTDDFLTPSDAL